MPSQHVYTEPAEGPKWSPVAGARKATDELVRGAYYRCLFDQHFTTSCVLGVEIDSPLCFKSGTIFLCERAGLVVNQRGETRTYVVLQALHPTQSGCSGRAVRLGFFRDAGTEIHNGYERINNELIVLALAATGLAL
jgi:hypothetical protein